MTYEMKPLQAGTRMRVDHSTYTTVILSDLSQLDTLRGDVLWEAPADGSYVKKGDKWLHVTHRNGVALPKPGWTAYIYLGGDVCGSFNEVTDTHPVPTTYPKLIGATIILQYDDGKEVTEELEVVNIVP